MIYIIYEDLFTNIEYIGIRKKVIAQIKVFEKNFERVYYTCYSGHIMYLFYKGDIVEKELGITKEGCNEVILKWLIKYKIRRTYIRYAFADKWFIGLLKKQKENNIKSIIEIPTYPYDGEGITGIIKLEDSHYRLQMRDHIEKIATNTDDDHVFGISCIRLVNGVNIDENPLRIKRNDKTKIVLIGVSALAKWQGYERIITGVHDYYRMGGKIKIYFKIIGTGPEKDNYCMLVKKYHLEEYVEFLGRLDGECLNEQYNLSDLAVSSLGRYKSLIQDISPIKAAEYCARGIPFICGYHDMRFNGSERFILNVPNNSEPINMNRVVEFYDNMAVQKDYQEEMRNYAVNNLSWDVVMKEIVEYLR